MGKHTIIKTSYGAEECRICGLIFVPESEDDKERHEHEHRVLVCGGLPLQVREFLRGFGWAVAYNDGGFERQKAKWSKEIGKRAVVFGYWGRALANGIPENDFEGFMDAYFAFVDAQVAGDASLAKMAQEAIRPWGKYGG